jgi:multiple sugar transport system permease protein
MAMMIPATLLILGFIAFPILDTFWMSINKVDQFGRTSGFEGTGNYVKLFADQAFRDSFVRTVVWTVAVVGLTVAISLPLAWILSFRFPGRVLLRAFLLLPWAASLVITSLLWRWMAHPDFGAVSRLLADLGLVTDRIEWLANPELSFPLMIWIAVWVSIPSITLILLAGIQGVDPGLYEAAAIDGATSVRMFRSVALPLLRPVLAVAILLQVVHVFNSFPIIWVLTEGGPAGSTDTLVTYLYKLGFRLYDMGSAAAVSVLMFGILLVFAVVHTRLMWKDVAG